METQAQGTHGRTIQDQNGGPPAVSGEGTSAGISPLSRYGSLSRQPSILSLTLDNFNFMDPGRNVGSMNINEFIRNLWNNEEVQGMNSAMTMTGTGNGSNGAGESTPDGTRGSAAGTNGNGLSRQVSLTRQGSLGLTVPGEIGRKTVEEVWKEIHKPNESNGDVANGTAAATSQSTWGEMTLEDFLFKAGVVKEGGTMNLEPYIASAVGAVFSHFNTSSEPSGREGQGPAPLPTLSLAPSPLAQRAMDPSTMPQRPMDPSPMTQRPMDPSPMTQRPMDPSGMAQRGMDPSGMAQRGMDPSAMAQRGIENYGGGAEWLRGVSLSTQQQQFTHRQQMQASEQYNNHRQRVTNGAMVVPSMAANGFGGMAPVMQGLVPQGMVGAGVMSLQLAPASPPSPMSDGQPHVNGLSVSPAGHYTVDGAMRGRRRAGEGPQERTVERRQRRMIKNRESAARSRARKQAYTVELESEVTMLKEENNKLKKQQLAWRLEEITEGTNKEMMNHQAVEKKPRYEGALLRRTRTGPW